MTTPTNEELDNLIEVYTKKIENLSLELEKCRHNISVTGDPNELKVCGATNQSKKGTNHHGMLIFET